jgi:hypothetical protein
MIKVGEINEYWILVAKPEGKTPLGEPRRIWKSNNQMGRREI